MEIKLANSEHDLFQILALQAANHRNNVPEDIKATEGFVSVKHDLDVLKWMNQQAQQVIAVDKGKVIGYALVMVKEAREMIPILAPMFEMFEKIPFNGKMLSESNFYVMGQVCIAKEYRGKGIFQELFSLHKTAYSDRFDLCLTEVSSSNPRSMKAHHKVGFQTIHTFKDESDEWNILGWDWS